MSDIPKFTPEQFANESGLEIPEGLDLHERWGFILRNLDQVEKFSARIIATAELSHIDNHVPGNQGVNWERYVHNYVFQEYQNSDPALQE